MKLLVFKFSQKFLALEAHSYIKSLLVLAFWSHSNFTAHNLFLFIFFVYFIPIPFRVLACCSSTLLHQLFHLFSQVSSFSSVSLQSSKFPLTQPYTTHAEPHQSLWHCTSSFHHRTLKRSCPCSSLLLTHPFISYTTHKMGILVQFHWNSSNETSHCLPNHTTHWSPLHSHPGETLWYFTPSGLAVFFCQSSFIKIFSTWLNLPCPCLKSASFYTHISSCGLDFFKHAQNRRQLPPLQKKKKLFLILFHSLVNGIVNCPGN